MDRSSISIACWVVVYSPQIIENFRCSSADGLSLAFIVIWLFGDISNLLGSVLQGVLPTMTILAAYYIIADFVLLGQCFYYRGSRQSGLEAEEVFTEVPTEQSSLLWRQNPSDLGPQPGRSLVDVESPEAHPKPSIPGPLVVPYHSPASAPIPISSPLSPSPQSSLFISILQKISAVFLVCLVGIMGWYISSQTSHSHNASSDPRIHPDPPPQTTAPQLNVLGQIFGYISAALYLGSRFPQILLNYKRSSTEGVSILFFIFSCMGNLTYTLSIFAYEPRCIGVERVGHDGNLAGTGKCETGEWERAYWRYILVNASWVTGSIGALSLDLVIFGQFWLFRGRKR